MKRLYCIFLIMLLPLLGHAQFEIRVSKASLGAAEQQALSEKLTKYTMIEVVAGDLKVHLRRYSKNAQLGFPTMDGAPLDIVLEEYEIRGVNYMSVQTSQSGQVDMPLSDCPTYRGTVNGMDSSFVRMTVTDETVQGVIYTKQYGYLSVEPLSAFTSSGKANQYVLYNLKDVKESVGTCVTDALNDAIEKSSGKNSSSARIAVPTTCRIIELATEADFEYAQTFGGNPNANILGIINTVDGVYQNDLNIRIIVVFQHFWNTAADPYGAATIGTGGLLTEFGNHWNANFQNVQRDLAHLFTGRTFSGILGVAWNNSVCNNPGQSYSITVEDNNSFYTTAHEIGHNLGAGHETSNCTGPGRTVMCQGGNIPNVTFSQNSRNQINNNLSNNGSCLQDYTNISITGPDLFCSSGTYTASVPGNPPITWASSPGIMLSTTTGNSTTATYNASGQNWVEATFNAGCAVTARRYFHAGPPEPLQMQLDGSTISQYSLTNVCTYSSHNLYATISGGGSASWQIVNNSSGASLSNTSNNGAQLSTGYNSGNFTVKLALSNSCGTVERFYPFSANTCGYFSYTVSPNPATDKLNIEFENSPQEKNFPESFELFLETTYGTMSPVRKLEVRDETSKQQLRATKKFTFDVSDLARGRYILRVTKEKEVETETSKKVETMHIVLH